LKNDKTIIAYHFGQYYCLLQKEWRLPKIEIGWLIKVLRNGWFHNGPVICPLLSHNGPRKLVLVLGVASGQYNLPWAIMTNLGHITDPLWKHPFIYTIVMETFNCLIILAIDQGRIQDFKLGVGAHLKKIAPSAGRCENLWGISCEKSRFYAKKSYFFQF
jgi:hypothetical protein